MYNIFNGYVSLRSFSEIFFLVKTDRERRANEPIAIARLQTPLEDQPAKLETMKIHLSWAEHAERQGKHTHFSGF